MRHPASLSPFPWMSPGMSVPSDESRLASLEDTVWQQGEQIAELEKRLASATTNQEKKQ